jgi:hypothetical protein
MNLFFFSISLPTPPFCPLRIRQNLQFKALPLWPLQAQKKRKTSRKWSGGWRRHHEIQAHGGGNIKKVPKVLLAKGRGEC